MQGIIQLLSVLAQVLIPADQEAVAVLPLLRAALILAPMAAATAVIKVALEETVAVAAVAEAIVEAVLGPVEQVLGLDPIDLVMPEDKSLTRIMLLEVVERLLWVDNLVALGEQVDHQRIQLSAAVVSLIVAAEALVVMVELLEVAALAQVALVLAHRLPIEVLLAVVVAIILVQTVALVQVDE